MWTSHDVTFVTAPTARLLYPVPGTSDVSASETVTWSGVTGAEAYRLRVGTTPGAQDIADSGETAATRFVVRDLAPAQTLYAEVATRRALWTVDAVTFTTATTARVTAVSDGADLGQGLGWTTILGATHRVGRTGRVSPGGFVGGHRHRSASLRKSTLVSPVPGQVSVDAVLGPARDDPALGHHMAGRTYGG